MPARSSGIWAMARASGSLGCASYARCSTSKARAGQYCSASTKCTASDLVDGARAHRFHLTGKLRALVTDEAQLAGSIAPARAFFQAARAHARFRICVSTLYMVPGERQKQA